jgi:hypothetical protein
VQKLVSFRRKSWGVGERRKGPLPGVSLSV